MSERGFAVRATSPDGPLSRTATSTGKDWLLMVKD